ncbi:MAG: thiamine pyrophosphate-dependent enzyme [Gemmataceae bacterium]
MITQNQPTDFASEQEVRWCPGCGDFAILAQIKKMLADMPLLREEQVFLSGIGCASRMPNYLSTYGFRGLHGGAVSAGMGLKLAQPNLTVWIVLGDGEGFGAATQHLLHACRRNVDIKVLFINNEIRGLSRGQESATTRPGTLTATCPEGSSDNPWHPCALALAAGATFVARSLDVDVDHLGTILQRASEHKGFAFVEILQNCKVYNDLVFDNLATQHDRPEHLVYLEHGKPMVYGAQSGKESNSRTHRSALYSLTILHQPHLRFMMRLVKAPLQPRCSQPLKTLISLNVLGFFGLLQEFAIMNLFTVAPILRTQKYPN